jgi:hypothetical protein
VTPLRDRLRVVFSLSDRQRPPSQSTPFAQASGALKVFANADAAEKWFEENDPEGIAFEDEVLE